MLETTWFLLWGLLWGIYFALDGYVQGLGILLPFVGSNEAERRMVYNSSGPFWDGNQVWLITAGGVTFAAFPATYAVMFSALYAPLLIILFALIVRGVSFEFRSKFETKGKRYFWDGVKFIGSLLPAVLFGAAFANIFRGIPIDEQGIFQGTILALLNPYGLCGAILFVLMFMYHGALWLGVKTVGSMEEKGIRVAKRIWPYLTAWALIFLVYTTSATNLFENYMENPVLLIFLFLPLAGLFLSRVFVGTEQLWTAWGLSGIMIFGVVFFGIIGLYPTLLPSSLDPAYSLTAFDTSSSPLTLKIMLGVVLVFVPIILLYQIWAYKVFGYKITEKDLEYEESY